MSMCKVGVLALGLSIMAAATLGGCDRTPSQSSSVSTAVRTEGGTTQTAANTTSTAVKPDQAGEQPAQPVPPAKPGDAKLPPPPIELRPAEINMGTLRPSQKATGVTHIHNVGDKPLRILASRADCSCTSVNLANQVIPPGGSVPVEAQFRASSLGDKKAGVRVVFEGYNLVEIAVRANVSMPVTVEPGHITAVSFPPEPPPVVGELKVEAQDQRPFRILSINGGPVPHADDFDPETDEPRTSYLLKWDFSDINPSTCRNSSGQPMPQYWGIETDHPEASIIDMEIRHECTRRPQAPTTTWGIQQRRYNLERMLPGESKVIELDAKWLRDRAHDDPIELVLSENDRFMVQLLGVDAKEDMFTCKVQVTVNPNASGFTTGTLRLHSKRQSAPVYLMSSVREQ